MGVVACNSREFLANCKDRGLFRPGDEDKRGEADRRLFSISSIDGTSDMEEVLSLPDEPGEI